MHNEQTVLRWLRIVQYGLLVVLAIVAHYFTDTLGHSYPGFLVLANTFATPDWVMRKVARRLVNNCVLAASSNCMRSYDDEFKQKGAKVGSKVRARLPQRYELTVGARMNATPMTDHTVDIEITDQSNVGMEYDSWSATLEVDDYMERYGNPAVDLLVNNIDDTGHMRMYKKVAKYIGTPGVTPGSTGTLPYAANQVYLNGQSKLYDVGIPAPYIGILDANMHAYLTNANTTLFNPAPFIAAAFKNGQFMGGGALGIDRWYRSQNVATHVVGALGSTPLIIGSGQVGSAILVDGTGGSVTNYWLEGDVIQFAGCYDINPLTHRSTGRLKDFAIMQDTDAVGGAVTANISPEMIVSGPFANCSNSPADNAAVTTFGHASAYANVVTKQGLVYNKEAFALVMADLVLPKGLWVSERISNAKLGISIRMLKDHDIINDVSPARLDTAHGWSAIREELGLRVAA